MGTTSFGVVGLASAVLTLAAGFFLGFPVAGLGAAVGLGSSFSGLAVLLLAVTLDCSGPTVTGSGEGFGLEAEWWWL